MRDSVTDRMNERGAFPTSGNWRRTTRWTQLTQNKVEATFELHTPHFRFKKVRLERYVVDDQAAAAWDIARQLNDRPQPEGRRSRCRVRLRGDTQ